MTSLPPFDGRMTGTEFGIEGRKPNHVRLGSPRPGKIRRAFSAKFSARRGWRARSGLQVPPSLQHAAGPSSDINRSRGPSDIGFDAVKHLVLCRVERRPPRLDLSIYPYLPRANVETTSAKAYMRLLSAHREEAA